MKITIYKCTKCKRERVERDNVYKAFENSVVKPNYETISDLCPACKRIKRLNEERRSVLDQNLEALREEYKTADEQRKREIKAMADSIKKDAIFANDVIDNLI